MVKNAFNIMPSSVLEFDKNQLMLSAISDTEKSITTEESKGWRWHYNELKLTEFNPDLAAFIYKFYLDKPAYIYDAFSGRATRGLVAGYLGHSYYGIDCSEEIVKRNIEIYNKQKALMPANNQYIVWQVGDSCNLNNPALKDESFDFAFTCPPYFDLEQYDKDNQQDISNMTSYPMFLQKMRICWREVYRVLKPDTFFVFVANYFRRDGKLMHLARDLVNLGKEAGFEYFDEGISVLRSPRALMQVGQAYQNYHLNKMHEFIEVLYKG